MCRDGDNNYVLQGKHQEAQDLFLSTGGHHSQTVHYLRPMWSRCAINIMMTMKIDIHNNFSNGYNVPKARFNLLFYLILKSLCQKVISFTPIS
jgi:hypothetical protein